MSIWKLLFTLLLIQSVGMAKPLTPEQKRSEFEHLSTLIKSSYGPYEYKRNHLKLSVDDLVEKYAQETANVSNLEFYYSVVRFIAEFKDSHFGARVDTNHVSKLGFIADRIQGKILIDEIDRKLLPSSKFPLERGDEIISMGNKPIAEVVEELSRHLGSGYAETALRGAATMVGFRPSSTVAPQYGTTTVVIRRGTSSIIEEVELSWHQSGDPVLEDPNAPKEEDASTWSRNKTNYDMISIEEFFAPIPKSEKSIRCSGKSRIHRPKDATVLIETPFVAYYHPTDKGNVGYLRIPHYYWKDAQGKDENDFRFLQYEWVIRELEQNTVGLIIDQDHNCGGSVNHLQNMVGLFAKESFKPLGFRFLSNRKEYLHFKDWVNDGDQYTIKGAAWRRVLEIVKLAWLNGETMSPMTSFSAEEQIHPNDFTYTKPIIMLIDEMSGSGGDAFPAMLQGIGRATLMGNRTMGAGGHVENLEAGLYFSGNTVRFTKSLFYHPNGTAIENNGATPDIQYNPSRDDFLYGYREYQAAYLKELMKLIP